MTATMTPAATARGPLTPSPVHLRLEVRRLLRNPSTIIFCVLMPVAFSLIFGSGAEYADLKLAHGTVAGEIMVNMALYGAMTSATIGGAMVALERTLGWSRQLQLTPLRPRTYIVTKVLVALALAATSVVAVYVTGAATGARLDAWTWPATAAVIIVGSSVFAAYGLAFGYLVPGGNGMSIAGPLLALLAFPGGMFARLTPGTLLEVAGRFTPMRGSSEIVRALVEGDAVPWWAPINVIVWALLLGALAVLGYRRDTERIG